MEQLRPEQAAALLKENGIEVSPEEAAIILEVLRMLAIMVISQHLEKRLRA
ncbi:hypothetical protein [Taibaiella helva]|uniref:hypothetical protein n=1 Tax=Taibaiella helva TaxID=2301235 RepID=UPI001300AAF7|nr:hypothetical protein [Taibaiella helva]